MKLQTLAIIFIIIILPISLILSAYTQNQIKTLNLQATYDSKLISSTYDAIKAFQINTLDNSSSDVATSKMRDIEASANTFFNSVANNFGLAEYKSDVIKDYVPALVYTLYDGYYIYSPYTNNIENINVNNESTYQNEGTIQGLKPYVYYSCRYKTSNSDFVITYTLDSYITIQGYIDGEYVNKSGYLLDNINTNGSISYRGFEIGEETTKENIVNDSGKIVNLQYVQLNGVKYYLESANNKKVFSIVNGKKIYLSENSADDYIKKYFSSDYNAAKNYYEKAKQFTDWVRGNSTLSSLKYSDAVDENGDIIKNDKGENVNGLTGDTKIFSKQSGKSIEDENSTFNEHRIAVIRYSIQKNLSIAIANFNDYSSSTNEFQMPELSETDWYSIINNVSMISFLQGVSIGGKTYNGYAVVTNNKTQEVVSEDSIYIINGDQYSRVNEQGLNDKEDLVGYFNVDFERKSYNIDKETKYCYPHSEKGSYTSIVNSTSVQSYESIHEYLKDKSNLAKVYYTALGRERWGMYRVNYNNYINF